MYLTWGYLAVARIPHVEYLISIHTTNKQKIIGHFDFYTKNN